MPINIHSSEWTDERIEHAYANSISEIPDISAQNTMGVRGKRIQALGLIGKTYRLRDIVPL